MSLVSTALFTRLSADLVGGTYTLDESLYIDQTTLLITNDVAEDCGIGVIGTVQEVPDLNDSTDRMVLRLSVTATQLPRIQDLIRARSL